MRLIPPPPPPPGMNRVKQVFILPDKKEKKKFEKKTSHKVNDSTYLYQ